LAATKRDPGAISIPLNAFRWVLVLIAVVLGVFLLYQQRDSFGSFLNRGVPAQIDHARYQAVFLTSGQIYFGHASAPDSEVLLLRDVYYLANATEQNPRGQLIKRGSEVHGPTEPMVIPMREVLFLENLRDDSDIVSAIARYLAGERSSPQPQQATQAPQQTLPQSTATPAATGTRSPSPSPTRTP
jgi:hypothetical protein